MTDRLTALRYAVDRAWLRSSDARGHPRPPDFADALDAQGVTVGIDAERLGRALEGIGVLDSGTWVSFNAKDAAAIARAYEEASVGK